MSLTLYGLGPSRSFRALWALCESKLEFDYVHINLGSNEDHGSQSPQYLSLNSQGKVPSLTHDDLVLTESAAIVNYINTLSSEKFIPTDAKLRAQYDELGFFILTELEQPLWTTGKHKFAIPEEHRVDAIFATAQWEFKKALKALNALVSLENYVIGDSFTFADILLAQTFNWAERFEFALPNNCAEYRQRMYQREGAQKAQATIEA